MKVLCRDLDDYERLHREQFGRLPGVVTINSSFVLRSVPTRSEADALFGKRTDVRSSNDRHANEQTNYLLQRLERFTGIAILTTNHETAIDEAFRRRLAVHVRFPVPDIDERERLWRAMLPEKAPIEDGIDFAALARKYVMSGGYIRNAVLRAAFLAADANESIGAYHLTHAALLEYEAMGKLATPT